MVVFAATVITSLPTQATIAAITDTYDESLAAGRSALPLPQRHDSYAAATYGQMSYSGRLLRLTLAAAE